MLFSCNNTGKEHFLSENDSFEKEWEHFSFRPSSAIQSYDDELYILSDFNRIYRISEAGSKLFLALENDSLAERCLDFQLQNETTYPFMSREAAFPLEFYLENFFVSEHRIYLILTAIVPFYGTYEGLSARMDKQFSTLVVLDRDSKRLIDLKSIALPYQDWEDHLDSPSARLAFSVVGDSVFIFRNLTDVGIKDSIPELLFGRINENWRMVATPLSFYRNFPKSQLTTNRGRFYGAGAGTYFGIDHYVRPYPIEDRPYKTDQWDSNKRLLAFSDTYFENEQYYRCLAVDSSQQVALQLMDGDSVLAETFVGGQGKKIIDFDFVKDEVWFIQEDTLSDGFYFGRYSFAPQ